MKSRYIGTCIVLAAAVLLLGRCSKGFGSIDTTLTVHTFLQTSASPADTLYTDDWIGYYFYADTNTYKVLSYEDARAGKLSLLTDPKNKLDYTGQASMLDTTRLQFLHLVQDPVVLVIVQPDSMIYAWRQLQLVDGLDQLALKLFFKTHQTAVYEENKWQVVPKNAWDKEEEKPDEEEDSGEEEEETSGE